MPDDKPVIEPDPAPVADPAPEEPKETRTGFEVANPAVDKETDPKAARRAELEHQLAELNREAVPLADLSDQELLTAFHDALVAYTGSHPSIAPIWQEMRSRIAKG